MIILLGILATVATIAIIVYFIDVATKPKTASPPIQATATTIVSPATKACTTTSTSTSSQGKARKFGKSVFGFLKGLLAFCFVLALICAILGGIFYGGLWLKTSIDNMLSEGGNTDKTVIVEVVPGRPTTIPIDQSITYLEYHPSEMTYVEYLDARQRPINLQSGGQPTYSVLTGPGIENHIEVEFVPVRFVRFSALNPGPTYSFPFIRR